MKNLHTPALLHLIPRTHELNKELYTNTHTYAHKGLYLQRHMCIEYKYILKLFSLSTSLNTHTHTHSAQHFDMFNLNKVGAVILLVFVVIVVRLKYKKCR